MLGAKKQKNLVFFTFKRCSAIMNMNRTSHQYVRFQVFLSYSSRTHIHSYDRFEPTNFYYKLLLQTSRLSPFSSIDKDQLKFGQIKFLITIMPYKIFRSFLKFSSVVRHILSPYTLFTIYGF